MTVVTKYKDDYLHEGCDVEKEMNNKLMLQVTNSFLTVFFALVLSTYLYSTLSNSGDNNLTENAYASSYPLVTLLWSK